MEISELEEQEDFKGILLATLSRTWSDQYGVDFEISGGIGRGEQRWRVQPMLSTFYTDHIGRPARRFMTDRFRYTPNRYRMAPQWALGTILGSRPGVRLAGGTGFWVSPPVPASADIIVIPGCRRIRIFDFRRHITRAVVKDGFSSLSTRREIEVRAGSLRGPFVRITESDPGLEWFEEPIVPGFVLPRCPPWIDRESLARKAISLLQNWDAPGRFVSDAEERAYELVTEIEKAWPAIAARFDSFADQLGPASLTLLRSLASALGRTEIATVHGDFQPGNILVEQPAGKVLITDWEQSTVRFRHYDAFTYILKARYGRGLDSRIARFVSSGKGDGALYFFASLRDKRWRVAATALFLLEEIERAVTDISSAPYSSPPLGFRTLCDELPAIIDYLDHQAL